MGRALCLEPEVLLLDEPTEGLMPAMIDRIREVVVKLQAEGKAILLVEQRVDAVLSIADRVTFIENGHNVQDASVTELKADRSLLDRFVGVGA